MCSFPLRCNAACESMCSSSSSSSMAMTMVAPKKGPPARRSRQAQPEKLIPSADRPASPCSQPITHATTITTTTTTQPQTTPKAPSAPKTTKPPRSPQCSKTSTAPSRCRSRRAGSSSTAACAPRPCVCSQTARTDLCRRRGVSGDRLREDALLLLLRRGPLRCQTRR